jgi:ribosomal protein S27AE
MEMLVKAGRIRCSPRKYARTNVDRGVIPMDKRKCGNCGAGELILRKTTYGSQGVTRQFICGACNRTLTIGTWGNVGFSVFLAVVLGPAILFFHPNYTLQTVPPLFFIGVLFFLALAAFEAYRLKQFTINHPVVTR